MTTFRRNKLLTNIVLFILVFCLLTKFVTYAGVVFAFFATVKLMTR